MDRTSARPPLALLVLAAVLVAAAVIAPAAGADHTTSAAPNDPLFRHQWGPRQIGSEQAWHHTRGAGTIVAIVDSGIDLGHPDLSAKVLAGKTYLRCAPSGCGNGDWQSGPRAQRDGEPHGTHVAGIAGAATSNGRGIAGVAPGTRSSRCACSATTAAAPPPTSPAGSATRPTAAPT